MNAVPIHQALFWPADSPVSRSGEVDFTRLAEGLAGAEFRGVRGGAFGRHVHSTARRGPAPRTGGRRRGYSCAQHAVVISRAVDTLAVLKLPQRRALAMHVWLAEVREAELNGRPRDAAMGARKRLGLRFMEMEALADVLARTLPWDGRRGNGAAPASRALIVDRLLVHLAGLETAERNRLALHALFSELLPAGLCIGVADAALRAAGLDGEAPECWVEILRLVRRMAEETVRRDVRTGACIERTGFPALVARIEPMAPEAAARLWLERYRVLGDGAAAGGGATADTRTPQRAGASAGE